MIRTLAIALLLAFAAPAYAAEPRASLTDIEDEVMCLECGTALNVSNSDVAAQQRDFIAELIAQGKTKQQVKDALVAEYGPRVLAEPGDDGFQLTAWLVPGYLSAVSGIRPGEIERAPTWKVLGPSLLFVVSFSAIFIVLGLGATKLGSTLNDHIDTLEKISGGVIIAMGVFFLATPFVARLNREWHVDALMARAGSGGPVLAGAAFAIAWTPCIGPTLGAILTAAALSETTGRGAYLLAWYSAGLAIPFLLTAVAFNRMTTVFAAVKRHYAVIVATGGAILIVMGEIGRAHV